MSINVAIIDDHPMVLAGLMQLIGSFDHIHVTGSYSYGEELLEGLKQSQPDVLLLDIQLPDYSGDELTLIIKKEYPQIRILAITSIDAPFQIKKMLKLGCLGYLLKNANRQTLLQAIQTVYNGEQFITPSLKELLVQDIFNSKKKNDITPTLTRREKEILQYVAQEYKNIDIANKLFLSISTVENHRKSLFQKFDVKNMAGLIKKAGEFGMLE